MGRAETVHDAAVKGVSGNVAAMAMYAGDVGGRRHEGATGTEIVAELCSAM
jgi:hypothetical protein